MEIKAKVKYKGLEKVVEALSKEYTVKVGLLANKGGSDEVSKDLDLAGLGAVQEFGCQINVTDKMRGFFYHHFGVNLKKTTKQITIPARSFLQMPLERKNDLQKKLAKHFGDRDDLLEYIARTGDMLSLAIMLGSSAVEQIQEAFETHGWGQWAENSPLTIADKGSSMQLVDKGRLRQSITYEVENGK